MGVDMVEHVATLEALASECDWCVEFGVRSPDEDSSTMSLLRGVRKGLMSFDIHGTNLNPPQRLAASLGKSFMFVLGDSRVVEIGPTDLLMIDTDHTYEQLRQELARHCDKVGKYIVMHDTVTYGEVGGDRTRPGMWQAVMEFLQQHSEWQMHAHYENCNGLTVLRRVE